MIVILLIIIVFDYIFIKPPLINILMYLVSSQAIIYWMVMIKLFFLQWNTEEMLVTKPVSVFDFSCIDGNKKH